MTDNPEPGGWALERLLAYAERVGRLQAQLDAIMSEPRMVAAGPNLDDLLDSDPPSGAVSLNDWIIRDGARWYFPGAPVEGHNDEPSGGYLMRDGGIVFKRDAFGPGWRALGTSGGSGELCHFRSMLTVGASACVQFLVEVEPLNGRP